MRIRVRKPAQPLKLIREIAAPFIAERLEEGSTTTVVELCTKLSRAVGQCAVPGELWPVHRFITRSAAEHWGNHLVMTHMVPTGYEFEVRGTVLMVRPEESHG